MPRLEIERPWLADYQREFLYNPHRFTVTEAATKVGKTLSHSWWLFEMAHIPKNDGDEFLWLAPTHRQAQMVFEDVARKVAHTGAYKINRSDLTIETPHGGILRYKTAEIPDNLYGPSNIEAIVGDEFTRWRPLVWPVVRSLATARRCPVKLIGNYIGEHNWGHRLAMDNANDPEWTYYRVDAYQAVKAGIMDGDEVESARRSLPPGMFAALYLCQGTNDPAALCQWDAINDLWTNERVAGGDKYITADVARYGSDLTVIAVWDGLCVVHLESHEKTSVPDVASYIGDLSVRHGVPRSRIVVDDDGIGGGVVDMLRGCKPFKGGATPIQVQGQAQNYANLKAQCSYTLAQKVNSGELFIGPTENRDRIAEELAWIKRADMDKDGKLRILGKDKVREGIGRSPDFADVLMMRMLFEVRQQDMGLVDYLRGRGKQYKRDEVSNAIRERYKGITR